MNIALTKNELQTILESLRYSKIRVAGALGTPENVRESNLYSIQMVEQKITLAIKEIACGKSL